MNKWQVQMGWLSGAAALLLAQSVSAATIVVYGATGSVGSVIVREALSRGDTVIGVARDPQKVSFDDKNFHAVAGDVTDEDSFRKITAGADAVILSVVGPGKDNLPENSVQAQAAAVAVKAFTGAKKAPYVLEIGGASTLYGSREGTAAHLPVKAEPGSVMYGVFLGHWSVLEIFRASTIRWTVLTPPQSIQGWSPNAPPVVNRTGKYRTATDSFVTGADGKSAIDIGDLAVAAIDEVEKPHFVGQRFTVGY
ncbi:MAG: NAD(P)H-binding protein [Steroidobacteraceae bacterium]